MFVVLYKWKIRTGFEERFISAWSEVTKYHREYNGSLGSRLHRGSDGCFYGYAQWPSEAVRRMASTRPSPPAAGQMKEAVEESFPETKLETVADFLLQGTAK